ncbi:hypothetical protein Tco_0186086 [Tanacetum coccineum]
MLDERDTYHSTLLYHPSPDYTPASPDYSPASDSESDPSEDPSSDHTPPLPATSPFLSSDDDTINNDSPDTPPSSTHDSSSEASSDFHSDASSDSSSRHSLSDHSSPDLPSTSTGPSRKRRRSPMTSVPALPLRLILGETSLRDVVIFRGNEEQFRADIDPEIQAEIDECFTYANALRDRGIDARVVVEVVDREESETGARGPVEVRVERVTHPVMPEVITEPAQKRELWRVPYETLGDWLRGSMITTADHSLSKMPNTRSGASMTHEEVEELVTRRVAEEIEAREAARTLEPLNENGDEQEGLKQRNWNMEEI